MATTTPNYGWTVPTSTDLVKDGATAIETLGDAIDASMNTALGTKKAGMVLLNTTSFSGVSSQSFNDVFSATYKRYLIIPSILGSTTQTQLLLRLRVAGADNSSTNYRQEFLTADGASASASRDTGRNSLEVGTIVSTIENYIRLELHNPFQTLNTSGLTQVVDAITGNIRYFEAGLGLDVTTSYTGFTLIANAGTMTGSVSIYGYNV